MLTEWNTLVEEQIEQVPGQAKRKSAKTVELKLLSSPKAEVPVNVILQKLRNLTVS